MADIWLEKFRNEAVPIIKLQYNPEKILLFGSRVKGNARESSDIDVIIVSKAFYDIPFIKRMALMIKKVRFKKHIDFICYTPDEFDRIKNSSTLIIDALSYAEAA